MRLLLGFGLPRASWRKLRERFGQGLVIGAVYATSEGLVSLHTTSDPNSECDVGLDGAVSEERACVCVFMLIDYENCFIAHGVSVCHLIVCLSAFHTFCFQVGVGFVSPISDSFRQSRMFKYRSRRQDNTHREQT